MKVSGSLLADWPLITKSLAIILRLLFKYLTIVCIELRPGLMLWLSQERVWLHFNNPVAWSQQFTRKIKGRCKVGNVFNRGIFYFFFIEIKFSGIG